VGDNHLHVGVVLFDLHHLREVQRVAQAARTRDMQHDDPAVFVQDLQLVVRQEIVNLDVLFGQARV